MLNQDTKRKIDSARDILVGKVPDPKAQVEQITTALIYKFMDDMDKEAQELGGRARFFTNGYEKYSWTKLMDAKLGGHDRLDLYVEAISRLSLNPHIPQLFRDIFKDAFLPYRSPETLSLFLKEINGFAYTDSEDLGDAFEYLLSVLGSQGDAGQFRTPRHIIDFIVNVVDPKKDETVCDPACGTAGFLISAYKHILKKHDGLDDPENKEKPLTPDERKNLMDHFTGYDISPDMVKLSRVNLYLHGFPSPTIHEYDTLSSEEKWDESFDVMLANPPFMSPKGGIKPHKRFSVQANRSEVLFVDYILEHLRPKGRAGIIVPEGIIFQSAGAYKALRKMLVDDGLITVVSLPAGVFNPYAGVKTSILLFDNEISKKTKNILFLKIQNDGFGLGAQRREHDKNDLPFALAIINKYKLALKESKDFSLDEKEKQLAHLVTKEKIAETGDYNLSGDRYKETLGFTNQKWELVELGDVCDIYNGSTPLRSDKSYWDNGTIPWFTIDDIRNQGRIIRQTSQKITVKALEETSVKLLPTKTILLCCTASVGEFAITEIETTTNQQFNGLVVKKEYKEKLLPEFLFNLSKTFKDELLRLSGKTSFNFISVGTLKRIKIPLPPLEVQKEIVEQIEIKQNAIDHAKAVIENLERERRYFGQSLRKLKNIELVKLENICDDFKNGVNFSKEQVGKGTKFVNIKDLFNDGYVDVQDLARVELRDKEIIKNTLKDDDLLFVRSSVKYEGCGYPSLVKVGKENIVFCGFIIKCSPNKKKVYPKYLLHLLRSEDYRNQVILLSNRANITNISQDSIKSVKIILPSIETQELLADEAEKEQEIIDANKQLIEIYERKISNVLSEI